MRIFRIFFSTTLTFLVINSFGTNNVYALEEYDLGKVPDKQILEEIETQYKTIPESQIQALELSQRPDPLIFNESGQFLIDLEKECTQKVNQYQLRNTETKIKSKLNLLRQFNTLAKAVEKLDTQVSEYTSLCVSESEFNREMLKINSILSNKDLIEKYVAVSDQTLTCNIETAQSITSDYLLFNTSYGALKTYNDSIISRYNQLVIDDLALSEKSAELSDRNITIGEITSKVIENQKLLDLKLKTAVAEKNKSYEELRTRYESLTKNSVLSPEEVKKDLTISEEAVALSLDDGETWMLTKDINELFRYFSLLKNNSDQVQKIKSITLDYEQKSEDIKSSLAQKLALNLILEVYSLETVRNNSTININNEKQQNIAAVSETHRLLAEERKILDKEFLKSSSTLHSALQNCSSESETEFNKYKTQYDALNSDFRKHIDDNFKSNLSQKELSVMTDVKSASATEPQLVFSVAKKLSEAINQLTTCSDNETLNIQLSSEPISTVTVAGLSGLNFQVEGNEPLTKSLNDIQSLSATEMLFNGIDINYYVSNLNTKINDLYQQETLGTQTIIVTPINPWTQDITTLKETYVTYDCSDKKWIRNSENSLIKVVNGFCKNMIVPAVNIMDAENKTFIPDLVKTNIDNIIIEKQFKQFGTCQIN